MRFNNHINGTKSNVLLQRAIKKYNLQDFIFIVFEYCDSKELISREQIYLDTLLPEFNILKKAGSSLGYKHTDEAKTLMSRPKSPETKQKMSEAKAGENNPIFGKDRSAENNPFFGKKHSSETLQKMSEAQSGKSHSSETKQKMSEAHKGKVVSLATKQKMSESNIGLNLKKVFVYKKDSESKISIFYKEFSSCTEAALFFDCSTRIISYYLGQNKLYKKEWLFYTSLITDSKE
jgi:group I intron endonuclease